VSMALRFSKQRGVSVATPTPSLRARRAATSLCSLSRLVAAAHNLPGSSRGRELLERTLPFGRLCVRPICVSLEQHHRRRGAEGSRRLCA